MQWSTLFSFGKIVVLGIVSIFLIILLVNAERTNDWRTSRTLCLSDKRMCNGISVWFNAEDYYVGSTDTDDFIIVSVCVRGDLNCVSDMSNLEAVSMLQVLGTSSVESEVLSTVIDEDRRHNYFYSSFLIVFLCLVSACLTVLFDCKVAAGHFMFPKDSLFMVRVNLILGVVISSLMIESARLFSLMHDEKCDTGTSSICSLLNSDGLEIRSILRPPDLMVTNYSVFCLSSSAFLLIACMVCYMSYTSSSNMDHQVLPHEEVALAIRRRGSTTTFVRSNDNNLAPYWLPETDPAVAAAQARCRIIMNRLVHVKRDESNFEAECAICLSFLFPVKSNGSKGSRVSSFVSGNRLTVQPKADTLQSPTTNNSSFPPLTTQLTTPENDEFLSDVIDQIITEEEAEPPNLVSRNASANSQISSPSNAGTANADGNRTRASSFNILSSISINNSSNIFGFGQTNTLSSPVRNTGSHEEVVSLRCKHEFHKACLVQWISTRSTCPVCRASLSGDDSHDEVTAV